MKYQNECVRRQDRLLDEGKAMNLLENGGYGVLSMVSPQGDAYGIPVNFVWDGKESIYIHCAPEGRKLGCMAHHPQVSFFVVGHTQVLPTKFTANYESIVLTCRASISLPEAERMKALELFIGKYAPLHKETGMKYAAKSFHRTEIIRLDIDTWSGKCKHVAP